MRLFILNCLLISSCITKQPADKEIKDSTVVKTETFRPIHSLKTDTILKDENFIILGDTSNTIKEAITYVAIKFKPYLKFSDFKADTIRSNANAPIVYSSNPIARTYKTRITQTCKNEGVNFAGHYCFVKWGCGSPCQMSAVVDMETGIVYDGVTASLGYEFTKDSRMLIVNPPDPTGFYLNCGYCEPLIYVWNEKLKKFEKQ